MHKLYLTVLSLFLSAAAVQANSMPDSIGVENHNGKKLIIHQVIAKDTYYSIGRKYNVPPKEIMTFNDNKYLQIGVIVKVPTTTSFSESKSVSASNSVNEPAQNKIHSYIEHIVKPKENLSMLAEKYGASINDIKQANDMNTANLRIGQVLKIPSNQATSSSEVTTQTTQNSEKKTEEKNETPKAGNSSNKDAFIEHVVASNETIYSIATKYGLTMDQLKAKNNITTNSLHVGQKLLIKGEYPPKPDPAITEPDSAATIKDPSLRYPANRYGLNQLEEKGAAVWISEPDLDPSKMLVLHRSAPIGTVVKITNPMTNRTTFAKVVGKFTENESTKDVIIVMTKAVADALGALDKRFFCNLSYGVPNNE